MVTANRNGGGGSSGWWDGLPPRVRARFAAGPPAAVEPEPPTDEHRPLPPAPPPADPWARDLARLMLVVAVVAVANVLFLLVALSYMAAGPFAPPPGR